MSRQELPIVDCTSNIPNIDESIQVMLGQYHELDREEEVMYTGRVRDAQTTIFSRPNGGFTPEEQVVIDLGKVARNALFHSISKIMVKCSLLAVKEVDGYITQPRKESAISEGVMAAYYAIDRFDSARDTRLTSYVYPVVIDRVKKYLRTKQGTFSVSDRDVGMYGEIRKAVRALQDHGEPITPKSVHERVKGTYLGITEQNVLEMLDGIGTSVVELDEMYLDSDDTYGERVTADQRGDRPPEEETISYLAASQLMDGAGLTPEEQRVLRLYYAEGTSFDAIAESMGYSQSWVLKMRSRAEEKIQSHRLYEQKKLEGPFDVQDIVARSEYRPFLEAMSASSFLAGKMFGVSDENGYHNQAHEAYQMIINCLDLRRYFPDKTEYELRVLAFETVERHLDRLYEKDHPGSDGFCERRRDIVRNHQIELVKTVWNQAGELARFGIVDKRYQKVILASALGLTSIEIADLLSTTSRAIRKINVRIRDKYPMIRGDLRSLEGLYDLAKTLDEIQVFEGISFEKTAKTYRSRMGMLINATVPWLYAQGYKTAEIYKFVGKKRLDAAFVNNETHTGERSFINIYKHCRRLGVLTPWDIRSKQRKRDKLHPLTVRSFPTEYELQIMSGLYVLASNANNIEAIGAVLGYDPHFLRTFLECFSMTVFERSNAWKDRYQEIAGVLSTGLSPINAEIVRLRDEEGLEFSEMTQYVPLTKNNLRLRYNDAKRYLEKHMI